MGACRMPGWEGVVRVRDLSCGRRGWAELGHREILGNEGAERDRAVSEGTVGLHGVVSARAMESPGGAGRIWERYRRLPCWGGLEDRAWTRRKLGREEGGFAGCLLWVKWASSAWC